jgi:hypothetical protein
MFKFKGEVFSSDGTYAVQREDGTDIANVSRIEFFSDDADHGLTNHDGWRSSGEEYQEVINRIHAGLKIDETLRAEIKAALEGDSNDAEHDALAAVAEALGIKYEN